MKASAFSTTLLIFAKNPRAGEVKTRLGNKLGQDKAVAVYRKLIQYTVSQVKPLRFNKKLWYGNEVPATDLWDEISPERELQPAGDLGFKMSFAFRQAFRRGAQKVIIIGSDCPGLSTAILQEAETALNYSDLVLGPAEDGGYYLLGMSDYYPLFDDIAWSTHSVARTTLGMAQKQDLSHFLLPTLTDLDTPEDLAKFPHYDAST